MSDTRIVAPIKPVMSDEGIELYASDEDCGMSQRGLGRFVGVPISSLNSLIENILIGSTTAECLKAFIGTDLYCTVEGFKGAKIIKAEVCAAICEYYAFEAKNPTDFAKISFRKFSKLGIVTWIQVATGHTPSAFSQKTPEQLTIELFQQLRIKDEEIIQLQKEKTIQLEKINYKDKYISKATINAPGLSAILDAAQGVDDDQLLLASADSLTNYTLAEWIEYKKFPIPDKMYRQLRLKVAGLFESLRHHSPKKESRTTKNGNHVQSLVYQEQDFHYLENAFTQVFLAYNLELQTGTRLRRK
jgi:hypothetical protein